ncbi:MAG: hypothetical protein AAB695_01845 [Patescibacteria group bacterium]
MNLVSSLVRSIRSLWFGSKPVNGVEEVEDATSYRPADMKEWKARETEKNRGRHILRVLRKHPKADQFTFMGRQDFLCEFYIVRLWHKQSHLWISIVISHPAWNDGKMMVELNYEGPQSRYHEKYSVQQLSRVVTEVIRVMDV